jgi:hypothetical protein
VKAVQEPASPLVGVGCSCGGDTGESWSATAGWFLVASVPPFFGGGGCERAGLVRLVAALNTLLGPERTTACGRLWVAVGVVLSWWRSLLGSYNAPRGLVVGVVVVGVGGGLRVC